MTYEEATSWLFNQIPNYQNQGGKAYKPGLDRIENILVKLGNPHLDLKVVHVAGTNGKGSVCHMLAAALQVNGYSVGVFSSPHIFDFSERVKINGVLIPKEFVVKFIGDYKRFFQKYELSFFEITAALAFYYFQKQKVDIAIIETGLGGRLDATNVVNPELSIITSVGIDHVQFLGDTLEAIANEKAGIIKMNKPVVYGPCPSNVEKVILKKAKAQSSQVVKAHHNHDFTTSLMGKYQKENLALGVKGLEMLKNLGFELKDNLTQLGLSKISELTKFFGRYQVVQEAPEVIIDVAHNANGIASLVEELNLKKTGGIRIVYGTSHDKETAEIFKEFSKLEAEYYLTEFSNERSIPSEELKKLGESVGLDYAIFNSSNKALKSAISNSKKTDSVVVCGSFFLLSDLDFLKEKLFH